MRWSHLVPISGPEMQDICRRYCDGESSNTIGRDYRRSGRTILGLLKDRGVQVRGRGERGWKATEVSPEELDRRNKRKLERQRRYNNIGTSGWKYRLYHTRLRSIRKGIPFDITADDVICPEFCPVLGIRLTPNAGRGLIDSSPTLDRIIPEKGYVKGNIRVISNKANRIKNNATVEEMELVLADMKRVMIEGVR